MKYLNVGTLLSSPRMTQACVAGLVLVAFRAVAGMPAEVGEARFRVEESLPVATVPATFPVGFSLLTDGRQQYVAFYDSDRQMTMGKRTLGSDRWEFQALPSKVGWDSHNYITMAIDREGHLHVSGNMHAQPLVYFRTERAGDLTSLRPAPMVGKVETHMTYPKFVKDNQGNLIYHYRHGGSGGGMRIYNVYDPGTRTWSRLLDTPLFDGKRKRNAYPLGPVRGPDGFFHTVWVWRATPDCATNHNLSYARSKDLIHWESAFGDAIELPIRFEQKELLVDPIPINGGIINGCQKLVFDRQHRPIITYHKSDAAGDMQIYAARPEAGSWKLRTLTDWDEPVIFGGGGSMGFIGIRISALTPVEPSLWTMTYRHKDYGKGRLFIDETDLQVTDKSRSFVPEHPPVMERVQSDFPGMEIRRARDLGDSGEAGVRYLLQWETLGPNRDRGRKPPYPEPSALRLLRLVETHD